MSEEKAAYDRNRNATWNKERQKAYHAAYYQANKERLLAKDRERRSADPERFRQYHRENYQKTRDKRLAKQREYQMSKYGLTRETYDALLKSQGRVCAICGSDQPGGQGGFHVDHDHTTGQVRGLLCLSCNAGMGQLRDDPEILRKALAYLEAHRG